MGGDDEQLRDRLAKHFDTVMPTLLRTITLSLSSVAMQQEASGSPALDAFKRYAQMLYCAQKEVQEGALSPLLMIPVEANSEQFRQLLIEISVQAQRANDKAPRTAITDTSINFHDQQGGNVAVSPPEDSGAFDVSFHVPVVSYDNSNIDEVDRQVLEDYNSAVFGSTVKAGTSTIGLLTMKEVSRSERAGHVGKVIISCITAAEALRVLLRDAHKLLRGDKESVDMSKLQATALGFFKAVGDAYVSYKSLRELPIGGSGGAIDSFWKIRPAKLSFLGIVGGVSAGISIYVGIDKINKSLLEGDMGQSNEMIIKGVIIGALTATGGALTIIGLFAFSGVLTIVSGLIAIALLVLGAMFIDLVAKAVYMWIDRSLIGNHRGLVEPFRSAEEEVASLDLVFKGLTVEIHQERVNISKKESGELRVIKSGGNPYGGIAMSNGSRIKFKITVPKMNGVELRLSLSSGQGADLKELSDYVLVSDEAGGLNKKEDHYDEGVIEAVIGVNEVDGVRYEISYDESYFDSNPRVGFVYRVVLAWSQGRVSESFRLRS